MSNKQEKNKQDDKQGSKPKAPKFNYYWIYGIIALFLFIFYTLSLLQPAATQIYPNDFNELFLNEKIEKIIVVNQSRVEVYIKKELLDDEEFKDIGKSSFSALGESPHYYLNIGTLENFENKLADLSGDKNLLANVIIDHVERKSWLNDYLPILLPILIIVAIWLFIMRRVSGGVGGPGGQIFNIGKSKAMLTDADSKVTVTFNDVAGLDEAKVEVMEIVDFLKHPEKYTALGGKIPKGALLVGPPGTGKTLLAKAMAGEAKVPFFSISGSDFVEMFVGVGASRVRDLFKQAREKAPCIIFIDEIDAIGRARGKQLVQGNDERENTLNQLLVEMDGFSSEKGVIILAATNRPDVLDSALLRPGRFDRQIGIDRPDLKGREQIFKVHLKPIKVAEGVKASHLAAQTPGFVGADIANICNEAALIAARKNKTSVEMDDFNDAIDRVIGGLEKKNKIISPEEKEVIAYHEAGHAVCGWFLQHAHPLVKVSIVPRGLAALGYAQYLPKEKYIETKEELLDRMCMSLGGRAAERVIFNKISTGAQSDLDQVTKMAYSIVTVFGMDEKVGNVSFYDMANQNTFSKPYSDETAKLIDDEARNIIESQYERAIDMLENRREELDTIARELLSKEVIFKDDLTQLLGKRPWDVEEVVEAEEETSNLNGSHANAGSDAVSPNDDTEEAERLQDNTAEEV